jgi:hypothetical protein
MAGLKQAEGFLTNIGIQLRLVQALDDALDGLLGPVPGGCGGLISSPELQRGVLHRHGGVTIMLPTYILKLPPTKNLRAMMGGCFWLYGGVVEWTKSARDSAKVWLSVDGACQKVV